MGKSSILLQHAGQYQSVNTGLSSRIAKCGINEIELIDKLAQPESEWAFDEIVNVCDRLMKGVSGNQFLKLISGGEALIIDAVDGSETLADAKDTFAHIDPNFKNYGADEKGPATKEAPVRVYEMAKDATLAQMFGSLNSDVRKLRLSQAQIKNFVKKYRNWLRADGYETLFLFESNGQLFVARVYVRSDGGLRVRVSCFGSSRDWYADDRFRVVVLQLA